MHTPLRIATFIASTLFLMCAHAGSTNASLQLSVVAELYRAFSCEAVIDEPQLPACSFISQPKQVLQRYLSPNLTKLVLQDRRCVAQTREVCHLDFLPLWSSQDPAGATVKVLPGQEIDTVIAEISYQGEKREMTYRLVKSGAGWRVSNIEYGDGRQTLVQLLSASR